MGRQYRIAASISVVAFITAACSSSKNATSASSTQPAAPSSTQPAAPSSTQPAAPSSTQPAAQSSAVTSSAPAGGSCQAQAAAKVQAASGAISRAVPSQPLSNTAQLKGKLIFYIPVEQAATLYQPLQQGLKDAVQAVGAKFTLFDGQNSTTTENQGVLEAINQNASVIILVAVSPKVVSTPLQQALSKGIKVIDVLNGGFTDPLDGLYAHVAPDLGHIGQLVADQALATTKCDTSVEGLVLFESAFLFATEVKNGAEAEYKALCPSCVSYTQDIPSATIPTSTPQLVQSLLVAHPKIGVVLATNDKTADYVAPTLKSIGKTDSVKLIGVNAEVPNLAAIQQGAQVGDVLYANPYYLGWQTAYESFRAILGLPSDQTALQVQAVAADNASSVAAELTERDFVPAFKQVL